jgi:hypothetical protein
MRVRLTGVPASYTIATDLMVVDEEGNLYLASREQPGITQLDEADAMLVAGFYEPVQACDWREVDAFLRVIHLDDDDDQVVPAGPHFPLLERILKSADCTVFGEEDRSMDIVKRR